MLGSERLRPVDALMKTCIEILGYRTFSLALLRLDV